MATVVDDAPDPVADDKAFVDYSGKRVSIVDPLTGEVRMAELFSCAIKPSGFTYSSACPQS